MRTATSTTLLDDVWQALEELGGAGGQDSGAGPGWITAVSSRGDQLRILLRLPADQCPQVTGPQVTGRQDTGPQGTDSEGAGALADVADALRGLPALTDVDLEVRPHRASADLAATTGACWHELPATADLLEQRHRGWFVEGAQHRGAGSPDDDANRTVRVLVRARITREESVPDAPRKPA